MPAPQHLLLSSSRCSPHGCLLIRTPAIGLRGHPTLAYFILNNYICKSCFQIPSHSEVLGIRASPYLLGGHNKTHNKCPTFVIRMLSVHTAAFNEGLHVHICDVHFCVSMIPSLLQAFLLLIIPTSWKLHSLVAWQHSC